MPFLSLVTLLAAGVLALIGKERTRDRMRDPTAPVLALATDGKYGGVAFLLPLEDRLRVIRRMDLTRVPAAEVRRHLPRRDEPQEKGRPLGAPFRCFAAARLPP